MFETIFLILAAHGVALYIAGDLKNLWPLRIVGLILCLPLYLSSILEVLSVFDGTIITTLFYLLGFVLCVLADANRASSLRELGWGFMLGHIGARLILLFLLGPSILE